MKTTGLVILVLGVILMIYTGFTYWTKEKVVDIGKLEITKEKPHRVAWSPIAGAVLIVAGGIILLAGSKKG